MKTKKTEYKLRRGVITLLVALTLFTGLLQMGRVTVKAVYLPVEGTGWYLDVDGSLTFQNWPIIRDFSNINPQPWFNYREYIKIIDLQGVEEIGGSVFQSCYNAVEVRFPDNFRSIGLNAFSGCKQLTALEIPDSVDHIGKYAFKGVTKLNNLITGYCADELYSYVFPDSRNLESVTITGGAGFVGEEAFRRHPNLKTVTIQEGVTSIYAKAFSECGILRMYRSGDGRHSRHHIYH